jgi:hypothetical protein
LANALYIYIVQEKKKGSLRPEISTVSPRVLQLAESTDTKWRRDAPPPFPPFFFCFCFFILYIFLGQRSARDGGHNVAGTNPVRKAPRAPIAEIVRAPPRADLALTVIETMLLYFLGAVNDASGSSVRPDHSSVPLVAAQARLGKILQVTQPTSDLPCATPRRNPWPPRRECGSEMSHARLPPLARLPRICRRHLCGRLTCQKFCMEKKSLPPPWHVNHLSEKDFFTKIICDRVRWPNKVGGYVREVD